MNTFVMKIMHFTKPTDIFITCVLIYCHINLNSQK